MPLSGLARFQKWVDTGLPLQKTTKSNDPEFCIFRHSREGGNPVLMRFFWILAFARMTEFVQYPGYQLTVDK